MFERPVLDYRPTRAARKIFGMRASDIREALRTMEQVGGSSLPTSMRPYVFTQAEPLDGHGPMVEAGLILVPGDKPFWYEGGNPIGSTDDYLQKVTANRDPDHLRYQAILTYILFSRTILDILNSQNPTALLPMLEKIYQHFERYFQAHPECVYDQRGNSMFKPVLNDMTLQHHDYNMLVAKDMEGRLIRRYRPVGPNPGQP